MNFKCLIMGHNIQHSQIANLGWSDWCSRCGEIIASFLDETKSVDDKDRKFLHLALAILLLASNVFAGCPSGWVEWEGHCAAIPDPEHDNVKEYQPSNEKPSRHPEPAWQRGDVIADLPPSCAATRACTDDVAIEASIKGKLKAGVPLSDAETELFKTRGIASK